MKLEQGAVTCEINEGEPHITTFPAVVGQVQHVVAILYRPQLNELRLDHVARNVQDE